MKDIHEKVENKKT